MNNEIQKLVDALVANVVPFIKKYGVAVGFFLFGFHLHAQGYEWSPFWDEDSFLYRDLFWKQAQTQAVTARWLMIAGGAIWVGVHYELFQRLGQRRNE